METARQDVVAARGSNLLMPPAPERSVQAMISAAVVAERMLLDSVQRATRRGFGTGALVLCLSRLPPPGIRPHHRRIARSLLDEAALRHGGQVFALRNQDLVLLGPGSSAAAPLLIQLFGAGADAVQIFEPGPELLAYAEERVAEELPRPAIPPDPAPPLPLDAADALLDSTRAGDLFQAQVAAELLPGGTLRPLFREAAPRLSALAARLRSGGTLPDPVLFRDLSARLDARTLAVACADLAQGGPLSGGSRPGLGRGPALHIKLTVAGVLSPQFAAFAAAVQRRGLRAGVELMLMEACADPAAFDRAKLAVRSAGLAVVLDGIGHHALLLTHPGRLGADLVKVEWSDGLASADAEAALRRLGPARVVLTGADGEAALRWGYGRQIRRFQGRHVDAMLAASRLGSCAFAFACTLRLCAERASATSGAGRTGCQNTALLDVASPPRHGASA